MKSIVLLIVAAVSVFAADATGTWKGTLTPSDGGGGPAHMVLKQEGTKLTGTAGPEAGQQFPLQNGKAEDGNLTFDLPTDGGLMKFVLKQTGEEIKGNITAEKNGEKRSATIAVTRQK
jgi:hypothetical protein